MRIMQPRELWPPMTIRFFVQPKPSAGEICFLCPMQVAHNSLQRKNSCRENVLHFVYWELTSFITAEIRGDKRKINDIKLHDNKAIYFGGECADYPASSVCKSDTVSIYFNAMDVAINKKLLKVPVDGHGRPCFCPTVWAAVLLADIFL